jgi:hypothetical protein
MRRRAWTFIQQCDIIISFQMGLPSMIGLHSLETSLPRNIRDDDESFNEDCQALPTALPDSAPTQIAYLIAKARLAFGFANALEDVSRTPLPEWERLLEIDRDLRKIYDNVPDFYKLGQLSGRDSLILVSARFVLLSIHHKSLCVVHSRFLDRARTDNRFVYSRMVCLTSAMSILRFQAIQDQEIPVNGQLRRLTNYQTSLAIHDYLLAATIIAADLYAQSSSVEAYTTKGSDRIPTRTEMLKSLSTAAGIFRRSQKLSVEAQKAASVLEVIVKRFETSSRQNRGSSKAQQHVSRVNLLTPGSSPQHVTSLLQRHSHASDSSTPISIDMQSSSEERLDGTTRRSMLTPSNSSHDQMSKDQYSGLSRNLGFLQVHANDQWCLSQKLTCNSRIRRFKTMLIITSHRRTTGHRCPVPSHCQTRCLRYGRCIQHHKICSASSSGTNPQEINK